MIPQINFLAVVAAAIASMLIGTLWYSPILFARPWIQLTGIREAKIRRGNAIKAYLGSLVGSLALAYVLAIIINLASAHTIGAGIVVGFLVWLGFVATILFNNVLFEGQPLQLYLINAGYQLLSICVAAIILALWY